MVNSAGITKDGFLLRMKEEDFEQVMLVKLTDLRQEMHVHRDMVEEALIMYWVDLNPLDKVLGIYGEIITKVIYQM